MIAPKQKAPAPRKPPTDYTGWPIPATVIDNWQQGHAMIGDLIKDVGLLGDKFYKWRKDKPALLGRVNCNQVYASLHDARAQIAMAFPHAVCPDCQGMLAADCKLCVGLGYVGKFIWDNAVTIEDKAMREKLLKDKSQ